jgi:hypothetical protein
MKFAEHCLGDMRVQAQSSGVARHGMVRELNASFRGGDSQRLVNRRLKTVTVYEHVRIFIVDHEDGRRMARDFKI